VLRFSAGKKAVAGLILWVGLAAAGAAASGKSGNVYEPDSTARDAPPLQGSTWVLEGEGYAIRLQMIDDEERQAFLLRSTGLATDPFATRPGQPPRFLSFVLEIQNRTSGELAVNPMDCWLKTNRQEIETPMGLTDLSFHYHVVGAELPAAYEAVGSILLAYPFSVKPGDSRHGLLVYRAIEPKTKTFHVQADLVLPGGDVVRFAAPYRKINVKPH
jgi:hypothetical protein